MNVLNSLLRLLFAAATAAHDGQSAEQHRHAAQSRSGVDFRRRNGRSRVLEVLLVRRAGGARETYQHQCQSEESGHETVSLVGKNSRRQLLNRRD